MSDWMRWTDDDAALTPLPDRPGVAIAQLREPDGLAPWIILVRFDAGYAEPAHWHETDTIYVIRHGEMRIGSEGSYRPGDVRMVRAGTFYGPEAAGPEGCTFLLIGSGPAEPQYDITTARVVGALDTL